MSNDLSNLPALVSAFRTRWKNRDARMTVIDAVVRGDFSGVGPDDEDIENRSPNLVQVAMEDTAEAASLIPTIRVRPSTGSIANKKKASAMERIAASYLDVSQYELLHLQGLLHLVGFGFAVFVCNIDPETGSPRISVRDPRTVYPETGWNTMDSVRECIITRNVYVHQLPAAHQALVERSMAITGVAESVKNIAVLNRKVSLIEWYCEEYTTIAAIYMSVENVTPTGTSSQYTPVKLDRVENPGGICPVVIPQRISLDNEPRGQMDQIVRVMQAHIRLMGMVLDYADQAVYCLTPETKILTEDLEYVEVGKLNVGDNLVGFDEFPVDGAYRRWRRSEVVQTGRMMIPSYKVVMADGTEFTASSEHKWLVGNSSNVSEWVPTWKLDGRVHSRHGAKIVKPLDAWEQDNSYEAGYLAGVLDGEGWLSGNNVGSLRMGIAQRDNACLASTERALTKFGFDYTKSVMSGTVDNAGGPVYNLQILGGMREIIRMLMTIRPLRLLDKFHSLGGAEYMGRFKRHELVDVVSCEFVGTVEVVTLQTSTGTLIAEGYAHHNSDVWVKDLVGEMSWGGNAYIQLGPQGSIGRVPPAVTSLSVQQELQQLVDSIHLGGRWPKSRPGEIDQAIASAKFIEATAGMMNTVIRTLHLIMKRAMEQLLRIAFKQDLAAGRDRTIGGVSKNQQFLDVWDRNDIDLAARIHVDYGIGLGRDPAQSMVLGIQGMQTGLFSKEFVQENFEGLNDVALERARIDVEQLRDLAFAQLVSGLQDKSIPPGALVDIADARMNGDDIFQLFKKFVSDPQKAQTQSMVPTGLSGPQSAGPPPAAGPPPPQAPPAEAILAGLPGGGPGGPPPGGPPGAPPPGGGTQSVGRLSLPIPGRGGFASTQSSVG